MWRPFIRKFSYNTYDNFLKKQSRFSTDSAKDPLDRRPKPNINRTLSSDWSDRYQEFVSLKEKVRKQRKSIASHDENYRKKMINKFNELNEKKEEERLKKIEAFGSIRNMHSNKTRKLQPLNLGQNKKIDEFNNKEFFPFTPKNKKKPHFIKKRPKKQAVNLRQAQDKIMKRLRVTAPSYFNELKKEFLKIREQCEMNFDDYNKSRRLKRNNPYDIIKKNKSV